MADSPTYADAGDDVPAPPSRGATGGMPRWVKLSGIVALVLILLVAGLMVFGGGSHSPGRHFGGDSPSGDEAGRTPPAGVPDQSGGHTGPPPGIEH